MTSILSYSVAADDAGVTALLSTYTHSCGYTRAWVDPFNPLLVWFVPSCPADAAITALQGALATIVDGHLSNTANMPNPYDQVQAIFNASTQDAVAWVQNNADPHLAQFLSDTTRLRGWIFDEMLSQGIIG